MSEFTSASTRPRTSRFSHIREVPAPSGTLSPGRRRVASHRPAAFPMVRATISMGALCLGNLCRCQDGGMTPAATPVPGGPKSAAPTAGSENGPSTTVRIRPDVAALPTYVPGARPDAAAAAQIAKLSSNELPYPPQDAVVEAITRAATGSTATRR